MDRPSPLMDGTAGVFPSQSGGDRSDWGSRKRDLSLISQIRSSRLQQKALPKGHMEEGTKEKPRLSGLGFLFGVKGSSSGW